LRERESYERKMRFYSITFISLLDKKFHCIHLSFNRGMRERERGREEERKSGRDREKEQRK
jgi:hypothetical protein